MCTSRCICIFTQHRSAEPVCQAALLLPGLVLTPLISESVRPAAAGSVSTQPMRERVLPSGSTAVISLTTAHPIDGVARQLCCGSLLYVHIHICIIIKYNIYAPSRRICIFRQHRSAEPCLPGRASAAWSGRNIAHIRVGAPVSCRVSPKHRSCERRCCPAAQLPGLLFVPLIGGLTVLPGSSAAGLHSYMHIYFCIIASYNIYAHSGCICIFVQHRSAEPSVPGRAAAAWSCFTTAHARDGVAQQLCCQDF
jgi:hypothetical protein